MTPHDLVLAAGHLLALAQLSIDAEPDLLVVVRGVCLFLELKAGSGVSPEQQQWHLQARARG